MKIIFTKHAKEKMESRRITEDEVINTIKFSEKSKKTDDKYRVEKNIGRGVIRVVYTKENYISVITVHWVP